MRLPYTTALALLALAGGSAAQIMPGPEPPPVAWRQELGAELPLDARFTDHEGREVALGELFRERPVVLVLVYYECPMLCGLVLEGAVRGLKAVDFTTGQDFDVIVASIDHEETPELAAAKRRSALAAYGAEVGDPASRTDGWTFLVGSRDSVAALAEAVGFEFTYVPERDEWAHAAGVTVVTPGGVVSRILFGVEFAPRDLRFALVEASQGTIGTALDQILLRCFHYDPARGKYGFAIMTAIRTLGLGTVAVLAFFVLRWLAHDRRRRALALE